MLESLKKIKIRPLQLSDLDDIMAIEPAAYGTHHWSRQSFVTELTNERGYYYGAECEQTGKLLGYTGFWLIGDEAHITTVAVDPQHHRQNIAERLLINSIIESRRTNAHWMTLEVRVSNEPAKALYTKYGFRNIGVRRRYYQDNSEDALVLWTDRITEPAFVGLLKERMASLKIEADGVEELFLGGESPATQPSHLSPAQTGSAHVLQTSSSHPGTSHTGTSHTGSSHSSKNTGSSHGAQQTHTSNQPAHIAERATA